LAELSVHKKKVEDVKKWLDEKLRAPKGTFGGWTLVLTGQAGVGKSIPKDLRPPYPTISDMT
jgi:cell cycle checkpoint protein